MDRHSEKLEAAKNAIDALFGDTSVPRSTTRTSLQELASEIQLKLVCLDDDDARESQ